MRFVTHSMVILVVLTACSKSPPAAVATAAESASKQLLEPLVQKDASAQAKRLTEMVLSDKPECAVFRERMTFHTAEVTGSSRVPPTIRLALLRSGLRKLRISGALKCAPLGRDSLEIVAHFFTRAEGFEEGLSL